MVKFLHDHHQSIMSGTALLTAIILAAGLWFTWNQLGLARDEIEQTKTELKNTERTMQAANTYQIQKDMRALARHLVTDSAFKRAVNAQKIPLELEQQFTDHLWEMLHLYRSAYRLDALGSVSPTYIESLKNDYCGFLKKPAVSQGWDLLKNRSQIDDTHEEMRKAWCPTL